MDAQPFSVYSFYNSVYQDEEQVNVSLSSIADCDFYRSSPLKDTPSTLTLTSTTRNPVMVSTASLTFC